MSANDLNTANTLLPHYGIALCCSTPVGEPLPLCAITPERRIGKCNGERLVGGAGEPLYVYM